MEWLGIVYGASALITTALVFLASKHLSDRDRAASVRLGVSLIAGAMWPLVLLGVLEFGTVVAYTKVADSDEGALTGVNS